MSVCRLTTLTPQLTPKGLCDLFKEIKMALKKSMTISGDAIVEIKGATFVAPSYSHTFVDMYIKVIDVKGNKNSIKTNVGFFTDGKFSFSRSYDFVPEMSNQNFIAQSYNHLKTLLDFAGAEDC